MGSPLSASNWHLCCSSTTLNDGFIYFFFIAVSSLLDYNLFSVVDIDALGAGLATKFHTIEGVPCLAVEGHLARLGVNLADGGSLAAAADEAHGAVAAAERVKPRAGAGASVPTYDR